MFLGSEADVAAALAEAGRVLRPGGSLVLTTDNPLRLTANPRTHFEHDVPGLGHVVEESTYDPESRLDVIRRSLRSVDGTELRAEHRIRYFLPAELDRLAA